VYAVDANWNLVGSVTSSITIDSACTVDNLPQTAAMSGGIVTFNNVILTTGGSWTITADDTTNGAIPDATSAAVSVTDASFVKLQILLPGETAAPGTPTGKTGTPSAQEAGQVFQVIVNAVDAGWNVINTVTDTVRLTTTDPTATLPADTALVAGTATLNVTLNRAGSWTITASDQTSPAKTPSTSPAVTVNAGAVAKLQILLPGESAAPGTATGKTGSPSARTAGSAFNVTVNAVDAKWNVVSTITDTVHLASTDPNAVLQADTALVGGTATLSATLNTAGSWTLTASDVTVPATASNTSPAVVVNPGAYAGLQVLLPGESAAPGTATGKTGAPTDQTVNLDFTVIVNAVDANWNVITTTNPVVAITTSGGSPTLPANAALVSGTQSFVLKFGAAGAFTVTATDTGDATKSDTSPSVTVN